MALVKGEGHVLVVRRTAVEIKWVSDARPALIVRFN